jgi:hypothetical protein
MQKFVIHDNFLLQEVVMGDNFLQSAMLRQWSELCRFLSPMTSFCSDLCVIVLNSGVKRCRFRTYVLWIGGEETAAGIP